MFATSLDADARQMSALFADAPRQYAQEPYRRKLFLMYHRLRHNHDQARARAEDHPEAAPVPFWGYPSEQAFLDDLYLIRDSLIAHGVHPGAIHGDDSKHMLKLGLGQPDRATSAQAEGAHRLGQSALDPSPFRARQASVSCWLRTVCKASCNGRGRNMISRGSALARVQRGRLLQTAQVGR